MNPPTTADRPATPRNPAAATLACRLCGADAVHRFSRRVLGRYDVGFHECAGCRSLQTETPYWLGEAYASNLADVDTGAAQRNLNSLAATLAICRLFSLRDAIDFGGGDGLLCRLLRDHGINCYVQDKYAHTTYAAAFTVPDFARPQLLLSFEVFEHFAQPDTELAGVFGTSPDMLLVSTCLYTGQTQDWTYLEADAGQHVFFYSPQAMHLIAARHGYEARTVGAFTLFSRPGSVSPWQDALLKLLLRGKALRLLRVLIETLPKKGARLDADRLRRRHANAGQPGS